METIELVTATKSDSSERDLPIEGGARARKPKVQIAAHCCYSLLGIAALTWFAFNLNFTLPSIGFIYLILIVLTAEYAGFFEATVASIAAVICLDYFFAPPIFAFSVDEPADWLAFAAFEFTALVISRLALRAHAKAAEATARQQDSERLYETARQVLLLDKNDKPGNFITSSILQVFRVRAVALFDAVSAETYTSGNAPKEMEDRARATYYSDTDRFDVQTGTWFVALRLGGKPFGSLALADATMTPTVATALASLSAIVLERSRSFGREYRAEAARQAESLRAAVLDALAHDIKTPLTVIRAASSGLLAAGGLSSDKTELVGLIDEQSTKLNDLASHLLNAARLDRTDFRPQQEPLLFSSLLKAAIEQFDQCSHRERFRLWASADEVPVFGDRKLMQRALFQLLDNALKYSVPESPIEIKVAVTDRDIIAEIRNQGPAIAPAEQERIFDRFYRASQTRFGAPGTGLGLSIVRKIADAHRGRVWVESGERATTAFFLALPKEPEKIA
jgi:two-component system, OmpR family, sensor histidine kinase KdpD